MRFLVHVDTILINNNTYDAVKSFLDKFEPRFSYMEQLTHWSYEKIFPGQKLEIYLMATTGCYGGTVYDNGTSRTVSISLHNTFAYSPCKSTYRLGGISKFGNPGALGDYWGYMAVMIHETMHGIFPNPTWDRKFWNEGFASYLENTVLEHFGDINRETTEYFIQSGSSYYNWDGYIANDYRDNSPSPLPIQSSPGYDITAKMLVMLENTYGSAMLDRFYNLFANNLEGLEWADMNASYISEGRHRNDKVDSYIIRMFSMAANTNLVPTFRYDGPSGPGWGIRDLDSLTFLPDLTVDSMYFSNQAPVSLDTVTVYARIKNTAVFNVTSSIVLLSNSVTKCSLDVTIPAGSSIIVPMKMMEPIPGTYNIVAFVDRINLKVELNENNNSITRQITFEGLGNYPPVLVSNIPTITWSKNKDTTISIGQYFSDPENGTLTFTATTAQHISLSFNQSVKTVTLSPNALWRGVDSIRITASDLYHSTSSNTFALHVKNNPPVQTATLPAINIQSNTSQTIDLRQYFSDPDGDSIVYAVPNDSDVIIDLVDLNYSLDQTGLAVFWPNYMWAGKKKFAFTVTDTCGGSMVSDSFSFTVRHLNNAPKKPVNFQVQDADLSWGGRTTVLKPNFRWTAQDSSFYTCSSIISRNMMMASTSVDTPYTYLIINGDTILSYWSGYDWAGFMANPGYEICPATYSKTKTVDAGWWASEYYRYWGPDYDLFPSSFWSIACVHKIGTDDVLELRNISYDPNDYSDPGFDRKVMATVFATGSFCSPRPDTVFDSITTSIRVATSQENLNNNICVFSTVTNKNGFSISEVPGLEFKGTERTYYVRLTPNDGIADGPYLDTTFVLYNPSPPVDIKKIALLVPRDYFCSNGYPNPFNPVTCFNYTVPYTGGEVTELNYKAVLATTRQVEMAVYDIKGRRIKDLLNDNIAVGYHQVFWNGMDDHGKAVNSGTYLVLFKCEKYNKNFRIILLK